MRRSRHATEQAGEKCPPPAAPSAALGVLLAIYGLWALARIPSALRSPFVMSPPHFEGPLASVWNIGLPWSGWALLALGWLCTAAMVVGGISVVLRWIPGMRVGILGLGAYVVCSLLGVPLAISLAMGWVTFAPGHPALHRVYGLPPELLRLLWWIMFAVWTAHTLLLFGALLWLRHQLYHRGVEVTSSAPST